jgi:hypothetical protein
MVDKEFKSSKPGFKKRIDELINKDMIQPDQRDGLNKMIDSPDEENFEVVKELLQVKFRDKLIEGLNEDQLKAFDDILEFILDPDDNVFDAFILKGYAGTGKTFLVKRIIEFITTSYPKRQIAITAPTNKAVRVLQADAPFNTDAGKGPIFEDTFNGEKRLKYSTVHKLLGLKEQITHTGEQKFSPEYKGKSELSKFKYLIVDEVSMLDDALCRELLKHKDTVKIIFMGDPAQIPPVNRADCIPFRDSGEYNFKKAELQKIMRQTGDHPVIDASFIIRNNLTKIHPIPALETNLVKDKGIVYINAKTERKSVRPLLKEYFDTDEFREDADYAKVIAWTNRTVNYVNSIIREILYGKGADPYVIGEKLIARSPIFERADEEKRWGSQWEIIMNTSEEMEITDITIHREKFSETSYELFCDIYQCEVSVYDPIAKRYAIEYITLIHENSMEEYREIIKKSKEFAIKAKDKSAWVAHYNILKWSADVSYNYAITAHKAQGSTYDNVILMEEDLELNRNTLERNRIKYTAYSRPKNKLFILRKNYV